MRLTCTVVRILPQDNHPEIFVNRKPRIPEQSGYDSASSHGQHSPSLHAICSLRSQPLPGQYSQENGPNCRKVADDPLGIAHTVVQAAGKERAVEPGHKIAFRIHEWNVASRNAETGHREEAQNRPVAQEAGSQRNNLPACIRPEHENSGNKIADRNPLQYAFHAPGMKIETVDWHCVNKNTQRDQNQGSFERVPQDVASRFSTL